MANDFCTCLASSSQHHASPAAATDDSPSPLYRMYVVLVHEHLDRVRHARLPEELQLLRAEVLPHERLHPHPRQLLRRAEVGVVDAQLGHVRADAPARGAAGAASNAKTRRAKRDELARSFAAGPPLPPGSPLAALGVVERLRASWAYAEKPKFAFSVAFGALCHLKAGSREPVAVDAAERVELLAEVDEYAVRVRVLRTGAVGLIPAWNTEGALERLTRMNTAFNEAVRVP